MTDEKPSEEKKPHMRNTKMPSFDMIISVHTRHKRKFRLEILSLMATLCKKKVIGSSYTRWVE